MRQLIKTLTPQKSINCIKIFNDFEILESIIKGRNSEKKGTQHYII